ncbi:MAG TPA: PA14 domain-containing protein [Candidatus Limnocylindrales bacterium]|nr:PA14 domain-containing protein [Candidatus Limnocylindrales bacterium]
MHAQTAITHQIALPSGMSWCSDTMINGLLTQVNAYRAQNGVAALSVSQVGMKDAEIRATQFASYMSTTSPGTPGFNPHQGWDTTAASLGYNIVSENLAYMTIDPAYVVDAAWQDSLHIAAMLATDANVAGVSCLYYSGIAYWTYEPGTCATCTASTPPTTTPGTPSTPPAMDSEDWAFLTLINNYRAQNGLRTLQVSATLENASLWMSNDMATMNYASHTDSLGRSTGARLAAFNYTYTPWGENIAGGYSDAQSNFTGWLNACDADASGNCTYAHRQNMLNPSFAVIGIGRAYSANSAYGWYWTTDFGGVVDQVLTPPAGTPPPAAAPAIASFTATPSTVNAGQSATLTWSVSGATSISIGSGVGPVTGTSISVTPAQTTTYTLTAANATGFTTAQTTVTVSALTKDTQPPSTPVLTSVTAKSSTEADLVWAGSTDNVGVTGYQVLRNSSVVASVSGAATSFADTTVQPGAAYSYSVRAFDAAGNFSAVSNAMSVTLPSSLPSSGGGTCPSPAVGSFTACYYNNLTLSGSPALTRTDAQINFDWGSYAPDSAVTAGNFSVRWQGYFTFAAGSTTFKALTSDGMRIYIDGNLILDRWRDQASTFYTFQQTMTAGSHLVTVEFYEHSGWATAHLTWQGSTPVTQLPVILSFSASPSAVTKGSSSTLTWSVNGATTIAIDNAVGDVSSLTSKVVTPGQNTTYTLTATNSAGSVTATATVSVAAQQDTTPPSAPILSSATAKSATEVDLTWIASTDNTGVTGYQVIRNGSVIASVTALAYSDLSASPNTIYTYAVRAYDAAANYSTASSAIAVSTPASGSTGGSCPPPGSGSFTGCYYNNVTLSGTPALVRTDPAINFDWGTGSPSPSITPNAFSARWQGYFTFAQGTYNFTSTTSDGMRLYVDGNLVLDRWRDQAATMYTTVQTLGAGSHLITVEYYEQTGWPTAHVTWQKQ